MSDCDRSSLTAPFAIPDRYYAVLFSYVKGFLTYFGTIFVSLVIMLGMLGESSV